MKVLIYSESQKRLKKSGIGRAYYHQQEALKRNDVNFTLDPKDDFDLVHINTAFKKSYKFLKKMKKKGIPVLVHGHSTIEDFRNSFRCWRIIAPWFKKCLFRMYGNADKIVTPTVYSKKLISNYPVVKCEVVNISNGIDLEKPLKEYTEGELNEVREEYNLGSSKVVMGMGLYFERKGLHDFIEIAKKMPDVKFVWVGQKYRFLATRKIVKAIKKKPENVVLTGYVASSVVHRMFKIASCFFFPSYEENEGIVVLEALAHKTPLLVRDIEVFDWIKKDKSCLKGKNNDEFCKSLEKIINQDNSKMIEEGYKLVEERSLDKVGKELRDCYEELLKQRR